MGQFFSKAPVSSSFLLGYSLGFPLIYFSPDSLFQDLRSKLFRPFEKVDLKINPSKQSIKFSQEKIIDHLIKLSQDDTDDEKIEMRLSVIQRTHELADREEEWVKNRQLFGPESTEIENLKNEFEAVKRLSAKNEKV